MSRETAASGEPPASAHSPLASRSFLALLLLGIAIRCVALTQPLVDAQILRQCQTAAVTRDLLAQPGVALASRIPWLGDTDAQFVLEAPLYNYLVMAVHGMVGNLEVSGKLTSIALWALSFVLLQCIWRRWLEREQIVWANVLFVLAPLEVFFGQAFMPEMLVQALAFGFLLLVLRYGEAPTLYRWIICAAVGALGLLVKFPEVTHLYVILAVVIARRCGPAALFWPRHWAAAVASFVLLKLWGDYADSINRLHLPEWTSEHVLPGFVGTLASRFTLKPWLSVASYLGFFVIPGAAAFAATIGAWVSWRRRGPLLLGVWLLSLAVYYVVWFGNGGTVQSYYNLPAVAPLCALGGIGIAVLLRWEKVERWRPVAPVVLGLLLAMSVLPGLLYLFQQDRRLLAAALWTRDHTAPGEAVIFRATHRWDMLEYRYNPVLGYYAERPTFAWTRLTAEPVRRAALDRARAAVVTLPPTEDTGLAARVRSFRGRKAPARESDAWLLDAGFLKVEETAEFAFYRRN